MYRKSETSSNLQYMRSVALPNLPLSSPVLIQKNPFEYHKNTIFDNFNRFIDITNNLLTKTKLFEYYRTRIYSTITLLNRINKNKLIY